MIYSKTYLTICIGLISVVIAGCAEGFLSAGSFLSDAGDALNTVGTCLSPLTPVEMNAVFGEAPAAEWTDGLAEVTDAFQPDVQAFLDDRLGPYVTPVNYIVLRFYQLGPLTSGEVIRVEPLCDFTAHVYVYDADFTLIPGGSLRDFDGRRQTIDIPITRDTPSACLRIDLEYPSARNESIARLIRLDQTTATALRPQTVVLHFGGQAEVAFRNGWLIPAQVGPLEDPAARAEAVHQFRAVFAPFNLTVLTDDDPPPAPPFSIIYIGPTDLSSFNYGLAEIIDTRNAYPDDVAVVDTNQLALELAHLLGSNTYGRAIGMIAAHEMGHLLGLYHVADPDALMTGAQCQGIGLDVERMLVRQLKKAPIMLATAEQQQWVLGYQDPVADLLQVLGPALP
jgi:hypothetical protein